MIRLMASAGAAPSSPSAQGEAGSAITAPARTATAQSQGSISSRRQSITAIRRSEGTCNRPGEDGHHLGRKRVRNDFRQDHPSRCTPLDSLPTQNCCEAASFSSHAPDYAGAALRALVPDGAERKRRIGEIIADLKAGRVQAVTTWRAPHRDKDPAVAALN